MTNYLRSAALVTAALLSSTVLHVSSTVLHAAADQPFRLVDGDRVVLLGDTFFERAQRYGWLETALQLQFPKENIHFRNLGWSGDTVFADSRGIFDPPAKGYARMLEQVRGLKPTVILLNYGNNESFGGPDYVDTFITQYGKLLDDLSSTEARLVLVSPIPLLDAGSPLPSPTSQNVIRKQFVAAVQKLADDRALHFVNLWSPVEQLLAEVGSDKLTDEGVHLTNFGYGIVSALFAQALTGNAIPNTPIVRLTPKDVVLDEERIQKRVYQATSSDRSLTATSTGTPAATAVRVSAEQLDAGDYEVRSGAVTHCVLTSEQLAKSALSQYGSVALLNVEKLRAAIVRKNEMYFYRWRPQNITYLFLFRKHEQGNNAKEVDDFLPIIAELEDRIFKLKQAQRTLDIEIVRKSGPVK